MWAISNPAGRFSRIPSGERLPKPQYAQQCRGILRAMIAGGQVSRRRSGESSCITTTMPFAELANEVGQASAFVPPGIVQRGGDGCSILAQ